VRPDATPIVVHILDKEYRIACPEDEQDDLLFSARMVDRKMREIRASGKVIGSDRIAVMAALNIAHELLQLQREGDSGVSQLDQRIRQLREKVELALNAGNPLEL
jgi:cell division protein ZapA